MNEEINPLAGFGFILPKGLVDEWGNVHQEGIIRPATARDEIESLRHPAVEDYPAYRVLIMLSQTILQLGSLRSLTPDSLENLFLVDLDFLVDIYNLVNPSEGELVFSGESQATP